MRPTKEADERVTRRNGTGHRTGMVPAARAIHLARGYADSRIRGPSAHQIGPSPSHTAVGVQLNDDPFGTASDAATPMIDAITRFPSSAVELTCSSAEESCRQRSDGTAVDAAFQRVFGDNEASGGVGIAPWNDTLRLIPFQLAAPSCHILRLAH